MGENGLLAIGGTFGDFTVVRQLGKGGMGAVYLVRAPDGGEFAAKIMVPPKRDVPQGADARTVRQAMHEWRKRFAREAEFAMKIEHPNLIAVYDVGEDPDSGLCYIIMEYVSGGSLADRLESHGRLDCREACRIAAQIARALDVAHRAGVVHRDLKPDNIMFDSAGVPKLADLGIAKFSDTDDQVTSVTSTGMMIGTPAYMSPEQMIDSHNVDARSDIYTLGVVLYEMLTGVRPRAESSLVAMLAKAIQGEELPDVRQLRPDVPEAVAYVLGKMTASDRDKRIQTAAEAARMLEQAAAGQLRVRRGIRLSRRKLKRLLQTTLLPCVSLVAGLILLVSALLAVNARRRAQSPVEEEEPQAEPRPQVVTNIVERVLVVTNQVAMPPPVVAPAQPVAPVVEPAPQQIAPKVEPEPAAEPEPLIPEPAFVAAPSTPPPEPPAAREVAPPREEPRASAPVTDPAIRTARVGAQMWSYSLQDGQAVLCSPGSKKNCVEPIVKSDLEIPSALDGHRVAIVGENAFAHGANKISSVKLPPTLREIRDGAFRATRLRKVALPPSVERVGREVFPETVREANIARAAIASDTFRPGSLEALTVAADSPAHRLAGGVLYDRDGKKLLLALKDLSAVKLADGVEEVCEGAFQQCKRLKRVVFPSSLKTLGERVFASGTVREVVFEGDAPACTGRPFQDARKDLTIRVNVGSTGWQRADSTRLPQRWPADHGKDARLIFYQ